MSEEVKIFRLLTGEEFIGKHIESESTDTHYHVKEPLAFALTPQSDIENKQLQVSFGPLVLFTKQDFLKVNRAHVVYEPVEAVAELSAQYNSLFGNIITPGPASIVKV